MSTSFSPGKLPKEEPMPTNYNERSWAIDVITHINQIVANMHRPIRRAGSAASAGPELLGRRRAARARASGLLLLLEDGGASVG